MPPLTTSEIFLRLGAAFIAGALLGFERETRGRPAGLRTTVLTCLAAATAAILAYQFTIVFNVANLNASNNGLTLRSDPGRLAAGVLTGIGFLGAGTILRHGSLVRGVTTAAVLWLSTIAGLVFGSGEWILGFCTLLFAGITIGALPLLERSIVRSSYANIAIDFEPDKVTDARLCEIIRECDARIQQVWFEADFQNARRTTRFQVNWQSPRTFELASHLLQKLGDTDGVLAARWE